jgi:hypothetical protein
LVPRSLIAEASPTVVGQRTGEHLELSHWVHWQDPLPLQCITL